MTADQQAPAAGRQSRTRLVVHGVLSLVLVAAIFYYLLTKLDPAQVWAAIPWSPNAATSAPAGGVPT